MGNEKTLNYYIMFLGDYLATVKVKNINRNWIKPGLNETERFFHLWREVLGCSQCLSDINKEKKHVINLWVGLFGLFFLFISNYNTVGISFD